MTHPFGTLLAPNRRAIIGACVHIYCALSIIAPPLIINSEVTLSPPPSLADPCRCLRRCPRCRYHRRRRRRRRRLLCVAVAAVFVSPPAVAVAAVADAITAVAVSFPAVLS